MQRPAKPGQAERKRRLPGSGEVLPARYGVRGPALRLEKLRRKHRALNGRATPPMKDTSMSTKMTLPQIEKEVRQMDPNLSPDDEAFDIAVVLLAMLDVRPWKPRALARFTGRSERRIAEWLRRLRASRVVYRNRLHVDWWDPATGGIAFWMDVAIAQGYIEVSPPLT